MLLHEFLLKYHDELVARCRVKVAGRRAPLPSEQELEHGISHFLLQLIATLKARQSATPHPMVSTAILHGDELLKKGFTVAQVVHDYGDLCQAITELADEVKAPISAVEFGVLNRCLDDAIAGAVTEYARQRDGDVDIANTEKTNLRLGFLAHEARNLLNTLTLSYEAIKTGSVGIHGSTSSVHDRALRSLNQLFDRALTEVRISVGINKERINLAQFLEDVEVAASLEAAAWGVRFATPPIPRDLTIRGDRYVLASVFANLLQNAFKFTRGNDHADVSLRVREERSKVFIDVEDECGGLPKNELEKLFLAFEKYSADRSGMGLGLAICRSGIEANDGVLHVRDLPGHGCVFSVELQLLRDRSSDREMQLMNN